MTKELVHRRAIYRQAAPREESTLAVCYTPEGSPITGTNTGYLNMWRVNELERSVIAHEVRCWLFFSELEKTHVYCVLKKRAVYLRSAVWEMGLQAAVRTAESNFGQATWSSSPKLLLERESQRSLPFMQKEKVVATLVF